MRHYAPLTLAPRYQLQALLNMGHPYQEIAIMVGVHKSTLSREVRRNQGLRGYRPQQVHRRIPADTWYRVNRLLKEEWSPEQISGWLKTCPGAPSVSHEWLYQHVYRNKRCQGTLFQHLRCQRHRRTRYRAYSRRGHLPNRISIERHPAVVERRTRLVDWELDTIISKGHHPALISLTERKSRLSLIAKVTRRCADVIATAVIALLKPLTIPLHTLTSDNGREFAQHETM
ncbi:MAG: IS30 family transposase [Nitrospira sp.]|nr:IS30 family transposase [Nitrospira sp.]